MGGRCEVEGRVKVDEVEETGAGRREFNIWLRLGYASLERGRGVEKESHVIMRR